MAIREITSPAEREPLPPLKDVAHTQSNRLHDVSALLMAIRVSTESMPGDPGQELDAWSDHVRRLAFLAGEVVDEVQTAFNDYI